MCRHSDTDYIEIFPNTSHILWGYDLKNNTKFISISLIVITARELRSSASEVFLSKLIRSRIFKNLFSRRFIQNNIYDKFFQKNVFPSTKIIIFFHRQRVVRCKFFSLKNAHRENSLVRLSGYNYRLCSPSSLFFSPLFKKERLANALVKG